MIRIKKRIKIKREVLHGAASALLGFLLSASQVAGVRPFGIAYAAASKEKEAWRYGGAFLGYLAAGGENGLLYAAVIMICFACRTVFRETKIGKNRLFMPVCAVLCTAFVMTASLIPGFSSQKLLLYFCEIVFCFACALLFSAASDREGDFMTAAGRGMLAVTALAAFSPFRILSAFSPAETAACFTVLSAAFSFGGAAGAGMGALIGAFLDLNGGGEPALCMIFGLGGLLCGAAANAKKIVRLSLWAIGCVSAAVFLKGGALLTATAAECVVSALIMGFLPWHKSKRAVKAAPVPEQKLLPPEASQAIKRLGEELVSGARYGGENRLGAVERAADTVCRSCPGAENCWSADYVSTSGVICDVLSRHRGGGVIKSSDLPAFFAKKCLRADELCGEMTRQLAALRHRKDVLRIRRENEELMKKQYEGISELLKDLSKGGARSLKINSDRIEKAVRAYYPLARWDAYYDKEGFIIDVFPKSEVDPEDDHAAADSLSLAVGCRMEPTRRRRDGGGEVVSFIRREPFSAESSVVFRNKKGEKICGDCAESFTTRDGRAVVLISDGMGTGDAARELSASAVGMIGELVRAGASLRCAASAVLPVIEARFLRSGFVSLDLLEIDLFCGSAVFIKCGAAPSFIIRGSGEEKIFSQSLPAGFGQEPAVIGAELRAGDTVVMATDGAGYDGGVFGTPEEICGSLTCRESTDDVTAAAVTIKEA